MKNSRFVIFLLLAVPVIAVAETDWDHIRNDGRYVISGPTVHFPSDGGFTEVRYVDMCLAGNLLAAQTIQCSGKRFKQVPGRGSQVEDVCTERTEVTVMRPIITKSIGCVDRQWRKVREASNGPQGLYEWVCVAQGELYDEVPMTSTLTVSFYKTGRFNSIGAPVQPDSVIELEYSIPNCQ